MNGIENPIVFYPSAILMILSAIMAVKFQNIFYSLLSAVLTFICAGLFFYVLGSEYNAVIQILIYVIAIPIILGIAIMFTNPKEKDSIKNNNYKLRSLQNIMFLTGGIFILAVIYLIMTSFVIVPEGFNIGETLSQNPISSFEAFSFGIFNKYVYAFEIISVILTIVVVGLSLFKKEAGRKIK